MPTRRSLLTGAAALAMGASTFGKFTAASAKTFTITTVVKITGINWFNRMEEGIKKFGAENAGVEVNQIGPPTADSALQVQMVENLIAKKVSAICVVPNSPETLEPVLKRAMSKGIVVVGHEGSNLKNVDYDVEAFDNKSYGEHLMEGLASRMGGKGKYVIFVGHLTARTHNEWADAAIAYQKAKYPEMSQAVDRIESNEDQQTAYAKTKELLRAHPDITGIQGSSGVDVPGAALAIEEAGLTGKIVVVGTSLPSVSGKYIASGSISMISFWDPATAGEAMNKVALIALKGEKVADGQNLGIKGYEKIRLDGKVIYGQAWADVTKDNLTEYSF